MSLCEIITDRVSAGAAAARAVGGPVHLGEGGKNSQLL